jgi:hypothetical protein
MVRAASLTLRHVLLGASVAAATLAAAVAVYPPPPAWPAQHYHREAMYSLLDGTWNDKLFYYDFPNMRLRVDSIWVGGPKLPPFNFSSYWINDDLYMYEFDGNGSCYHMNMGFGMMRPDWFVDGDQLNTTYLAKKSDATDTNFYNTVWTRKCATCDTDPNGYFNYFSTTSDNGQVAGTPFRLDAPGPLGSGIGYVINEYYDFKATNFTLDATDFALPTSPACTSISVDAERASAVGERQAKVEAFSAYLREHRLNFPELLMALV